MFTGLIDILGEITSVVPEGDGLRMVIEGSWDEPVGLGDSIACDGVCLTAAAFPTATSFEIVAGQETLSCTTAGDWKVGKKLHLERALRFSDRLGGHLVQGHVDGVGLVTSARQADESFIFWVQVPPELQRYVAVKGSIALDGTSLTVNEIVDGAVRINLIPHTVERTHFATRQVGEGINVEIDLVARYVERLVVPMGGSDD